MPITRKNPRDPDSPFLTREALGKGVRFKDRYPHLDSSKVNVLVVDEPKDGDETVLHLPRDVASQLRATGPGWAELADKILREGLKRIKQKAA